MSASRTPPAPALGETSERVASDQLRDIQDLYDLFADTAPAAKTIAADRLPEPARSLLAHEGHMTVTLENHYRTRVKLSVLVEVEKDHLYARKILLHHGETAEVLQFGLMQIDLLAVPEEARARILARRAPLGRILIEQGLLRRISNHAFLEIGPGPEIRHCFGLSDANPKPVYGRLATLFCDEHPAIDLLEIVSPPRS